METLENIFQFCFYFGVVWTILSVFMTGMGSGDAGDLGDTGNFGDIGNDFEAGDATHLGTLESSGHVDHSGFTKLMSSVLGYLSPTVVAITMTVFGGVGLICLSSGLGFVYILIFTLPSGFISAVITRKFLTYVIRNGEKTSHPTNYDFIGQTAEVITPIPENGLGEIIMDLKKSRYNGPAKTEDGTPVAVKWYVKIKAIKNNTYIVQAMGPKENKTE